jgi:hypothetical protein
VWLQVKRCDHKVTMWSHRYRVAVRFSVQCVQCSHNFYSVATRFSSMPQGLQCGHKVYSVATRFTIRPQGFPRGQGFQIGQKVDGLATISTVTTCNSLTVFPHVSRCSNRVDGVVTRFFVWPQKLIT